VGDSETIKLDPSPTEFYIKRPRENTRNKFRNSEFSRKN